MRLYLHRHDRTLRAVIVEIVRDHTDFRPRFTGLRRREEVDPVEVSAAIAAVETLFYEAPGETYYEVRFGRDAEDEDQLRILLDASPTGVRLEALDPDDPWSAGFVAADDPLLSVSTNRGSFGVPVDWFVRRVALARPSAAKVVFVPAGGLNPAQLPALWDRVLVAGHEEKVETALRTVLPDLERLLLVGGSGQRSLLVKAERLPRPIALRSMGDGVVRIFGIALALVLGQSGVVLIDEVENGLHFSVQDQVWDAIFELAGLLNVQVVATTHSWDAVVGFQWAANRRDLEGMLYRLDRMDDGTVNAVQYSERDVAIAAEQRIEVR